MAHLDVRLTGGQEVMGLIPIRSGNILSWRLIMKISMVILSIPLIQEEKLSASDEGLSLPTNLHVYLTFNV